MENQLCTRYLQPVLQCLFDSEEENMMFKWTNTINFTNNENDHLPTTKNRPDGCIEDARKTIGFIEVKTIHHATNHRKINVDLYRLGVFGRTSLSKYGLDKSFQIMAIGTNLKFYICQNVDGIFMMTELDHLRIPTALDELPQFVPYFDRLYNILATIHTNCYAKDNVSNATTTTSTSTSTNTNSNDSTLEPKVLKAITERTVDRGRYNCFYHPCH
ncbi:hypothetical protein HMPREF1544_00965 [Mucor circinelloides 1006PhL]|uniref:Fungal-type protein kinase domain-containing protein n=1 Tax=Mucor circinelloides f. circinelloides (strain 1006PhL) TaxID=1220926 RepID=S2KI88_MUCC1|nr:hypothetical protein HMPREF1544_00965 [Mucor circinelloides 1006PhL]